MSHDGELMQLHISARNLRNLNNIYLNDPVCKIYHGKELIGCTEVQKKTLDPDWKQPIQIIFKFNQRQKLRFEVTDANNSIAGKLTELVISGENKENYVGSTEVYLSSLVGAVKSLSKLSLTSGNEFTGTLIVFACKGRKQPKQPQLQQQQQQQHLQQNQVQEEEYVPEDTKISWRWGGLKLLDMDFFSKSDPFANFYKIVDKDTKILVHQTNMIKNDLNPIWKPWETTEEDLCQHGRQIYVEVFDYDKTGGHDFIGSVTINYDTIRFEGQRQFQLLTKKDKKAGILRIVDLSIIAPPPRPEPKQKIPEPEPIIEVVEEPEPPRELTFLDYLIGGWQMSMTIGIDFTFSNQPITKVDSLHKIATGELNYYEKAIKYIGGAVVAFDHDKYIPTFGFGGVPKMPTYTKKTMDDCFPLNGKKEDPACEDIAGTLEAYRQAVPHIEFSGPTFIATILRGALTLAKQNKNNDIYTVALIMTDGQIEDLDESIKIIIECSELPMSLIMIGVGDENFKYMKQLDDCSFLKKHAKVDKEIRDIVQFVSYQEFKNDIEAMSAAVLENLPKQFMSYMKLHNILPSKQQEIAKLSQVLL